MPEPGLPTVYINDPADPNSSVVSVIGDFQTVLIPKKQFAHTNYRIGAKLHPMGTRARALTDARTFTPREVVEIYFGDLAKTYDGAGTTIGIVELGGGFNQDDLERFQPGLSKRVKAVSVQGAENDPSDQDSSVEVMLDIEIIAACCPKAEIAVYFAPNTEDGFSGAVMQGTAEDVTCGSNSWGQAETQWTQAGRQRLDSTLQIAQEKGINWTAAAGDNGADDGTGGPVCDFPASSAYVLACGGTRLTVDGCSIHESVWNDGQQGGATGGGISQYSGLPGFQMGLKYTQLGADGKPMPSQVLMARGVPDVAANADPISGYQIWANGQEMVVGGTSACSPLMAGLIALLTQANGGKSIGNANALFYKMPNAFGDVTVGDNGDYEATQGWDACSGLGSPGAYILDAMNAILRR
jgi:kumamolisin